MMMNSKHPFTEAQWLELEHQALIFKFMVSGLPIPPDLIFSINGATPTTTTTTTNFPTQPHHIGWTCFQLGLTKVDPEPTRCRRTDGKKWRCSRQSSNDSKYCERHMHRGKSRPRKLLDSKPPQQPFLHNSSTNTQHSNLSSVTSDNHFSNTHLSNPVKDSTFTAFLGAEPGWSSPPRKEKQQRVMYQFFEEKPQEKRDSWLNLVI